MHIPAANRLQAQQHAANHHLYSSAARLRTAAAAVTSRRAAGRQQRCRAASNNTAAAVSSAPLSAQHAELEQEEHHQVLMQRLLDTPLPALMSEAAAVRDQGHPRIITFSPKVFLPLTRLCRDSCGYCTFAQPPQPGRRAYMTLAEVLQVAQLGADQGCTEALFTLGDKPELLYPEAAAELAAMGYSSTLEYVQAAAAAVLQETGLIPHINAGVMDQQQLQKLKAVSGSQGLMLEGTSPRLTAPGGPHHYGCPDKEPQARLDTLAAAGAARVPFTTGVLIGLGESRKERLTDLLLLRQLHQQYGHIQEVIIQNFRAKSHTAMQHHPEPSLDDLLWTVAAARLVFGPHMNIQAPPNLTPAAADGGAHDSSSSWRALLDAGINDWGGISPITKDYVNPEKAWPHLAPLAAVTADAGKLLLPRLPVYPHYIHDLSSSSNNSSSSSSKSSSNSGSSGSAGALPWLCGDGGARSVAAAVHRAADSSGLVRAHSWVAGTPVQQEEQVPQHIQQQQHSEQQHKLLQQLDSLHKLVGDGDKQQHTHQQQGSGGSSSGSSSVHQEAPPVAVAGVGRSATPLPRPSAAKLWNIAVNDVGVLQGMPEPQQVSARIQQLLQRVHDTAHNNTIQQQGHGSSSSASSSSSVSGGDTCWSEADVQLLLSARGVDMSAVVSAADALRQAVCGDVVSYVVNRNINYTNVCTYGCRFCAFSKGKASDPDLRGSPYLLPLAEISRRTAEAWDRGATEVCLQGGIHPDFTGQTYLDILAAAKAGAPDIHVHAFSPLEVTHGASTLGMSLGDYLFRLKAAGLGSLPGTAAEVLDDGVRGMLCPDKINTQQWLEVVETAHSVGLRTTSTIMFGHMDNPAAWARHLMHLRDLQARTAGITEFVPLPFVHMEAPIYLAGAARRGPTLRECVLLHAVSRLVLHPLISNIQASWVKMGPQAAGRLLAAGCNDMGGSIMNESITRAAGASYGQELPPQQMEEIIKSAGRQPVQRTTLYGSPQKGQVCASFSAAALVAAKTR